ncbi:alpha/beta fold hydrolase [Corynebacterium sp. 335C]
MTRGDAVPVDAAPADAGPAVTDPAGDGPGGTTRDAAPSALARTIVGEGPTVVLFHGVCHSRDAWERVVPLLADDFRVVTVDLPGHGESPEPARPDVVGSVLESLEGFLAEVTPDGERPHLAGNSLGGYIALELALRGHAASALGLNPAGFFHGRLDQLRVIRQFQALRASAKLMRPLLPTLARIPAARAPMMGMFSARPWRVPHATVVRDSAGLLANTMVDEGLNTDFAFSDAVDDTPLTCAWGTADLTLVRGWRRHRDVLPAARLELLPGVGHVGMLDSPSRVAAAIRGSIARAA